MQEEINILDFLNRYIRVKAERKSLANSVPEAPPANCTDNVVKFLIRLPGGERLSRKFYLYNTIKVLFDTLTLRN